ncbi:twin-arginine translocation signal domain-containing protein [uncultured Draconibacterium sp.]|uniref:twin-arginine translocation signal domain-containing protein n=1 Tax=uncultured Draconibacterium sp. TaxID=1573823 RepID=UPI0029C0F4A9|nr:twin-arginine translocation signal domain-containing protein [uncultured Draconibacterium sp.]
MSNEYEQSRRAFLTKLGLTVGAGVVAGEKLSGKVLNSKAEFPLESDQQQLMDRYEDWMDEFIPVIKAFRANPNDKEAGRRIAELSEEAETWREQLTVFMKDDNFARYYMTATERMTKEIY